MNESSGLRKRIALFAVGLCLILGGCVTQDDYDELNEKLTYAKQENAFLKNNNEDLETQVAELESQIEDLQVQIDDLKSQKDNEDSPDDIPEDVVEDFEQEVEDVKLDTENIEYRTDISYDDLSRRPDDYMYEYIELSGTVIQLIEGDEENEIRVSLNSNGYDDVILCGYEPSIVEERILVEDKITIKGLSVGIYQYESTLSGPISVPAIYGMEITRN